MNEVTRNQTIGMVLLFVLLLVYLFFYSPTAPTDAEAGQRVERQDTQAALPADEAEQQVRKPVIADSLLQGTYGVFFPLLSAAQNPTRTLTIETEELELHFTTQGGQLQSLRLKKLSNPRQATSLVNGYGKKSSTVRFFLPRSTYCTFQPSFAKYASAITLSVVVHRHTTPMF